MKRVEGILLFLTLLFLPTQLGYHLWPQFSFIYSLKIDFLSPTIYFWDLFVVLLIAVFILRKRKVNTVALNLWLFFLFTSLVSLIPYIMEPMNLGPGLVRVEQYLTTGLFGVYVASLNFLSLKNWMESIKFKSYKLWVAATTALVTVVLVLAAFSVFMIDHLFLEQKLELLGLSVKFWLTSPLIGIGLNNFILYESNTLLTGISRFIEPVYNIFLLTLAETGIVGLLGLLTLIGYPIFRLLKLRTTDSEHRTLLLIWVVILILGLFEHYFLTSPQGIRILFLVWGISFSMLEYFSANHRENS